LEVATGNITTPLVFQTETMDSYQPVLATFTAGDLVVDRVGNGSTTLSSTASAISLVEYSTAGGSAVNTVALPSFSTGGNNQGGFTDSGIATSNGFLNLSSDGQYLSLIGIDAQLGTASVTGTTAAIANRIVANVNATGTVTIEAKLTDAFTTNNARAAVSTNGDDIWVAGTGTSPTDGIRYVNASTGTPTTSTQIAAGNLREAAIFGGVLFISNTTSISSYNASGTPPTTTTTGSALTFTTGSITSGSGAFVFFDRDGTAGATNLNGLDTLYVVDGSGIEKYEWTGTGWTQRGVATYSGTLFGLAAKVNGGNVDLYATTNIASNNALLKVSDDAGFGNTLTKAAADFTSLATAGANYAFRGVAFAPSVATPTVNLSVSANSGTEAGTTVITITATASSAVTSDQTVTVAVTGTNITAGDYTLSNTTLTIPSGQTTGTVSFTIVNDAIIEGDETATVTLSNPSVGITLGSTTSQNITITDNDGGSLSYGVGTLNEARALDGSINGKIVITLSGDTFTGSNNDNFIGSKATISNLPTGLVAVLTRTSDTTAELSFTGTATSHANANDASNIGITFNNAAYTGNNAAAIVGSTKSDLGINFGDAGNTGTIQTFTPNTGTAAGSSDASTALALDANWMVVGDDEASVLRVYPREGGAAVNEWNFASALGTDTTVGASNYEVDVEASTRIGDTLYFIGSHSNKKNGSEQLSRDNLFAVTVAGTGADTQFTYQGKNTALETALSAWDHGDVHGKGVDYFGLAASSATGVVPEGVNGFSIEGMTATQDGTQLLLGFRAPLSDTSSREKAIIVPVTLSGLISSGGTSSPTFGTPIELDLGGRGIRSIEKSATGGDYLIIAGLQAQPAPR